MESNHDTTHGSCGRTWKQRGNTTGHCSGCHETFEGITLFDAHFARPDGSAPVCKPPQQMEHPKGWPLKLVNGTWRTSKPHPRALTQ